MGDQMTKKTCACSTWTTTGNDLLAVAETGHHPICWAMADHNQGDSTTFEYEGANADSEDDDC